MSEIVLKSHNLHDVRLDAIKTEEDMAWALSRYHQLMRAVRDYWPLETGDELELEATPDGYTYRVEARETPLVKHKVLAKRIDRRVIARLNRELQDEAGRDKARSNASERRQDWSGAGRRTGPVGEGAGDDEIPDPFTY